MQGNICGLKKKKDTGKTKWQVQMYSSVGIGELDASKKSWIGYKYNLSEVLLHKETNMGAVAHFIKQG